MSIVTITKRPQPDLSLENRRGRGDPAARAMSLLFLLRRWREKNIHMGAASPRAKTADTPPNNAALASLAGGELAERFHSWRGRSGRRYICSVFPVDVAAHDAGLPDFAEAVVIAVRFEANGVRHVVAIFQCEHGAGRVARHAFVTAAGAQQWHVHLLTADPQKRRAALEDIEALCRPVERSLQPA